MTRSPPTFTTTVYKRRKKVVTTWEMSGLREHIEAYAAPELVFKIFGDLQQFSSLHDQKQRHRISNSFTDVDLGRRYSYDCYEDSRRSDGAMIFSFTFDVATMLLVIRR